MKAVNILKIALIELEYEAEEASRHKVSGNTLEHEGAKLRLPQIRAAKVAIQFAIDALGINRRAESPKVRGLALVGAKQSPLALSPVSRTSRA
jgi:hypothetical protein